MKSKADKERAKDIILAIIEAAGGTLDNKTNLYKAFYYAHLDFVQNNAGFLSTWPIVRMPNGPGIDNFDKLIGELVTEGCLEIREVGKGPHTAFRFKYNPSSARVIDLPPGALDSIKAGYRAVVGKTAKQVSAESHRRAWDATPNGREMNIYLDLLPGKAGSTEADKEADQLAKLFKEVWTS